jgi:hypothetical protein
MATRKKAKATTARPSGKKAIAKKAATRPASKGAVKRTRKATGTTARTTGRTSAKAVRPQTDVSRAEPLFGTSELADAAERMPVRKVEPARPARPPAKLPIPQSTFFF